MPLRKGPFFGLDKSHTLSLSWTSLPSCWSHFLPIVSSRPFLFPGTSWTAGSVKVFWGLDNTHTLSLSCPSFRKKCVLLLNSRLCQSAPNPELPIPHNTLGGGNHLLHHLSSRDERSWKIFISLFFWGELFRSCKWADHWIGWGISNQEVSGWNKWQDGEYFDQKKNKAFGCGWKIAPSRLGSHDYRAEIYSRKRFTPLVIRDFTFSAKSRKVWD